MKNKYWLHFKTIVKHKFYVFQACRDCGIPWRGLKHDMSKFSPKEFFSSARYFQGDSSPIDAEKIEKGYSIAWQNHKGKNTHHWQYWLDSKGKEIIPLDMPFVDIVELMCDWVGAGKAYSDGGWTEAEPYEYWGKNKGKMLFSPMTEIEIESYLLALKKYGWTRFTILVKMEMQRAKENKDKNEA